MALKTIKEKITINDFNKIDIRVGTIIEVKDFPTANKAAFQLKVDFGQLGIRKTSAQITGNYTIQNLINRKIIAILNFKPKQIANFMSEILVLGLHDDIGEVVLLKTLNSAKDGTSVT